MSKLSEKDTSCLSRGCLVCAQRKKEKRLLQRNDLDSLSGVLNHRRLLVDRIIGGFGNETQQSAIRKGQFVIKMRSDD